MRNLFCYMALRVASRCVMSFDPTSYALVLLAVLAGLQVVSFLLLKRSNKITRWLMVEFSLIGALVA